MYATPLTSHLFLKGSLYLIRSRFPTLLLDFLSSSAMELGVLWHRAAWGVLCYYLAIFFPSVQSEVFLNLYALFPL